MPALLLTLAFIVTYQVAILTCDVCDAGTYQRMGETYAAQGIVATTGSDVRLYGYPLFLAGIVRLSHATGIAFAPLAAMLQFTLYLAVVFWLASRLRHHVSRRAAWLVGGALLANVFVLPYLASVVTDGMSLTIQIALATLLLEVFYATPTVRRLLVFGLSIGALYAFAIMIRPANLYFGGFILCGFGLLPVLRPDWHRGKSVALPLSTFVAFGVVVLPQVMLNRQVYQITTFLPAVRLGDYQLVAGRRLLKCATIMLQPGHGQGIAYLNPWHEGTGLGLGWYLANPWYGARTAVAHIFATVDFDYYLGITTTLCSPARVPLFLASQAIVFWAGWGWLRGAILWWGERRNALLLFALALSAALVGGWLGIYALAAAENRFALPLFAVGLPWAAWGLGRVRPAKWYAAGWIAFAAYLLIAWHITNSLDLTKVIVQ